MISAPTSSFRSSSFPLLSKLLYISNKMNYELPQRKPNRMAGYEYNHNGAYFVTICARNRKELFGSIAPNNNDDDVGADIIRPRIRQTIHPYPDTIRPRNTQLSDVGMIVENAILKIPQIYNTVVIDCHVIMPNHIHMIVVIENNDDGRMISEQNGRIRGWMISGQNGRMISAPTSSFPSLSKIIGYFKQNVSRIAGFPLWQKSFHDRIIRNDNEYNRIAEYINNNPDTWKNDCFHINAT